MAKYVFDPNNVVDGLVLLQVNPEVAVDLKSDSPTYGYTFKRVKECWVLFEKLSPLWLEAAWGQSSDMMVQIG